MILGLFHDSSANSWVDSWFSWWFLGLLLGGLIVTSKKKAKLQRLAQSCLMLIKWAYTQNVSHSNLVNSYISTYLSNTTNKILSKIFSRLVLILSLNTFQHKYSLWWLFLSLKYSLYFIWRNYFNAKKANDKI